MRKRDIMMFIYWYPFRMIAQAIPIRTLLSLGAVSGRLLHAFSPGKRRIFNDALEEMGQVSNAKPDGDEIVRRAFAVMMQNRIESLIYPKLNPSNINRLIRFSGRHLLDEALAKGKGCMLIFGHFGANQMVMPALGHNGYAMNQVSAPATVLADLLMRDAGLIARKTLEIRWKHELSLPVKHISVFGTMKEAYVCLRKNEVLGIAVDGGGGKERIAMDFLGGRALFSTGAMRIAQSTGCTVLPTFVIRNSDGTNTIEFTEPISVPDTGDRESDMRSAMAAFVSMLETFVRRYPCHYLGYLALRKELSLRGDPAFFYPIGSEPAARD